MENKDISTQNQGKPFEKWLKLSASVFEKNKPMTPQEKTKELWEKKNYVFRVEILEKLLKNAEDDMLSAGMNEEQINQTKEILGSLGLEIGEAFLSLPAELREKKYAKLLKNIEAGGNLADELDKLVIETLGHRMTLGYHISDVEIPKDGPVDNWYWSIGGYEYDHRDDLSMAYYSLDYENLFFKRNGKYIYVVRADLGKDTAHRLDENNQWGRAPQLSVIDRFEIAEVNKEVDSATKELEESAGYKI